LLKVVRYWVMRADWGWVTPSPQYVGPDCHRKGRNDRATTAPHEENKWSFPQGKASEKRSQGSRTKGRKAVLPLVAKKVQRTRAFYFILLRMAQAPRIVKLCWANKSACNTGTEKEKNIRKKKGKTRLSRAFWPLYFNRSRWLAVHPRNDRPRKGVSPRDASGARSRSARASGSRDSSKCPLSIPGCACSPSRMESANEKGSLLCISPPRQSILSRSVTGLGRFI
jgi:hypothetical protein